MIAYTAWDSLRAIAREQDAQLALVPGGGMALDLCHEPAGAAPQAPGFADRVRSLVARLSKSG